MDYWTRRKRFNKMAMVILGMLGSSVLFIYQRVRLFGVALTTAVFAAVQVWYDGQYNDAIAVLLAFTRLWLFGLILTTITGHSLHRVSQVSFWKDLYGRMRWRISRLGWHRYFIELLFMLIIIISFGNFLVIQMSNLAVMVLAQSDPRAFPAIRSFFNHITIIPITMVYLMRMFGADQPVYVRKVPR